MQVYVVLKQKEYSYKSAGLTQIVDVYTDENAAKEYVKLQNNFFDGKKELGALVYYEYETIELQSPKEKHE